MFRTSTTTGRYPILRFLLPFFVAATVLMSQGVLGTSGTSYKLESLSVEGSTRIDAEWISEELGLKTGTELTEETTSNARSLLIGLGLFRSVFLYLRRGSQPGYAHLIISLEDDESVVSDAAIGAEVGITHGEVRHGSTSPDSPPLGYRFQLVGRNLLGNLHRGQGLVDVDHEGVLREWGLSYGLPRFTKEGVQFDVSVSAVDVAHRYLNAQGFGAKAGGAWSTGLDDFAELEYGVAIYLNKEPRFQVPGFPRSVVGPRLAYVKETRLISFYPQSGYRYALAGVYAPAKSQDSLLQVSGVYTLGLFETLWTSVGFDSLLVGTRGHSSRGEIQFDMPLSSHTSDGDQANFFIKLRGGHDRIGGEKLEGSAALIGLRYHSVGFIAELAFKITNTPSELSSLVGEKGD